MEINRIRWASRRGMLELDLILEPFLENIYPHLPQSQKELYWQLLEGEDQDLFNWFLKKVNPEDEGLLEIVEVIRDNTGMDERDKQSHKQSNKKS